MTEQGDDGRTIASRLARTVEEGGDRLGGVRVVDEAESAGPSTADPTARGTHLYTFDYDGTHIAEVYVHPERVHLEFPAEPDVAAATGTEAGLRVRPKAVRPPRALVFVESSGQVKPALDVVAAVRDALE